MKDTGKRQKEQRETGRMGKNRDTERDSSRHRKDSRGQERTTGG